MSQDNPMLNQVRGEYERNAHFKGLADEITMDLLVCSFGDAMNAHADAQTVDAEWLGTTKRLVCNALFKMYRALPAKPFDPKLLLRAPREMEA